MKNVKIFSSGIAMLVLFCSFLTAANRETKNPEIKTITGTVTENGMPLPTVSIVNKSTHQSAQTDFDGKYTIKAKQGDILRFSFLGYQDKEVKVGKSSTINVQMQAYDQSLSEVVVTSQGVSHERKTKGRSVSPQADKAVGASPNMVIRGYSSLAKEDDAKQRFTGKKDKNIPVATPNDEDYGMFYENPFDTPKNAPLSTFSIDVDNASYTNVRRMINNGQRVPVDAVRVEEMVNFFKYQYPQPKDAHPFSINTEYSAAPWNANNKILRIGLQGKNIPIDNLPASNLVFLIDVSGSMSDENKLPLLKQSFKILVNELRREDKVAIVVYAGAAGLVLPPTAGDQKQTIIDALERLNAGGSTAGGAGIELAYQTAQENFIKGGNNRVILATDGDFNVGSNSNRDMETLITEKRKSGVFLTCLGYGMGNYKDSKIEILADKGNGNYAYIDNIQEANRFLSKEFKGSMFAIAKDVKIQIEFNPNQVQAYRLIGYENRKLRPEDFTNDKIDAGELGSNHTVTALYEIIPTGVKSEFLEKSSALKYTKTQSGNGYSNELATIKFRYKKPDGENSIEMIEVIQNKPSDLQNASADFKFCTAVAWFGLMLRESKLIANKSTNDLKALAKAGLANDVDGYKSEFIRLVEGNAKI